MIRLSRSDAPDAAGATPDGSTPVFPVEDPCFVEKVHYIIASNSRMRRLCPKRKRPIDYLDMKSSLSLARCSRNPQDHTKEFRLIVPLPVLAWARTGQIGFAVAAVRQFVHALTSLFDRREMLFVGCRRRQRALQGVERHAKSVARVCKPKAHPLASYGARGAAALVPDAEGGRRGAGEDTGPSGAAGERKADARRGEVGRAEQA